MTEIKVSATFELARVRVIGSRLYLCIKFRRVSLSLENPRKMNSTLRKVSERAEVRNVKSGVLSSTDVRLRSSLVDSCTEVRLLTVY